MLIPLIKKDLTIVKGYTLGVVAIAFGLPLLLAWRQPQMGGMISLLMAVLISSVAFNLAISEKENQYPKATALLSSTPYTKGKVIVSKYALYFIIYVICCIAYLVEMQFVPELKLDNFAQTAALVFLIQAFGMGIFLPIQYKYRFSVLRKLGVEEKHIGKLILQQLSVWFGLPIITAIIVAAVVIAYFIQTISAEISAYIGFTALMLQIVATVGILAILLICYFISTWIIFRRSVNP